MSSGELATTPGQNPKQTEVGSVFVSNYPPFSVWTEGGVAQAEAAFAAPPVAGESGESTPLGLYLHIPFCRKRCKFCYFKVYTDKNSAEIDRYLEAMLGELERRAAQPAIAGRHPRFIYFGGGTPSYISGKHLRRMFSRVHELLPTDSLDEIAFECEPGTLTQTKLETLRELGVTRLSLGIENWDDRILEGNGRAHVSKEIERVVPWIQALDFPQVNVDLISGMVGETTESWRDSVRRTIDMAPDSVTIYQMELPFNTIYSKSVLGGEEVGVADWATKRRWHDLAIDAFLDAGYEISSGYTLVKKGTPNAFVYRNSVWQGCDLLSVGVSSFGHISGVHYQNASQWARYLDSTEAGESAIHRAYAPTDDERLTREFILQLKLGTFDTSALAAKFDADPIERFRPQLDDLAERGMLSIEGATIRLTRDGLLRVDSLLPSFYAEQYQNARYT